MAVVVLILAGCSSVPQSEAEARDMCERRIDNMWTLQSDDAVEFTSTAGYESEYVFKGEAFTGDDVWTAYDRAFVCTATLEDDGIYAPEVFLDLDAG